MNRRKEVETIVKDAASALGYIGSKRVFIRLSKQTMGAELRLAFYLECSLDERFRWMLLEALLFRLKNLKIHRADTENVEERLKQCQLANDWCALSQNPIIIRGPFRLSST